MLETSEEGTSPYKDRSEVRDPSAEASMQDSVEKVTPRPTVSDLREKDSMI